MVNIKSDNFLAYLALKEAILKDSVTSFDDAFFWSCERVGWNTTIALTEDIYKTFRVVPSNIIHWVIEFLAIVGLIETGIM